jgi:hypothetical protein
MPMETAGLIGAIAGIAELAKSSAAAPTSRVSDSGRHE